MYILILRCCVDFAFGNYFQSSSLKGYDPQISVDMLTFLNDSNCHPVRESSISCFCDAALTICDYTIFHARGSKGMTPKSVLMCWHSWYRTLVIQSAKDGYPDSAMLRWQPRLKKMYILILRCCVDNLLCHYLSCSKFKVYVPQISVDVLPIFIDSS